MDTLISHQLHLWPPLQTLFLSTPIQTLYFVTFSTYKGFLNFVHLE